MFVKQLLCKWFGIPYLSCEKCDVLRRQLEVANDEKRKLINALIDLNQNNKIPDIQEEPEKQYKPIQGGPVLWHVRQRELEAADRKQFELMEQHRREMEELNKLNKDKSTEDLEKELLGDEDANKDPIEV